MAEQRYRILSLSGGGVRGLITAVWLNRLEQKLGSPIAQHFDLIAGTSTGAIIACGLSAGIRAQAIVNLYQNRCREIFPDRIQRTLNRFTRLFDQGADAPRYDGQGLETVLKSVFGETRFGELPVFTLITSYDLLHREALVFKTNKPEHQSLPIWQITKASASAPVYFPAQIMELAGEPVPVIDGGVVANNPTACAIAEAVRLVEERQPAERINLSNFVVASFGTGETTKPITLRQSQEWGALAWVIPLIEVLFDGSADAVDYIARQLLAEANYFRFQTPVGDAHDAIDDSSPQNVAGLIQIAEAYLATTGDALLDRLVDSIKT
jgi:patatin-like phospholipase/acyl hydrolase